VGKVRSEVLYVGDVGVGRGVGRDLERESL
jgi:hypothetical protein